MVRKNSSGNGIKNEDTELKISQDEAKIRLDDRIIEGRALKDLIIQNESHLKDAKNKYYTWDDYNTDFLKKIFTTNELSDEYSNGVSVGVFGFDYFPSLGDKVSELFEDIDEKIVKLNSILERVELYNVIKSVELKKTDGYKSNKVFIVHGHDEQAKNNLEILIRELGLEPVVLHRQADEGMTVIEKFEKHSNVGYAFILLTPDEVSYLKADEDKEDSSRNKEKRARPNVIFEFGYFVGKLGRSKVCCLHTGDVSLPSDVSGMIYKQYTKSVEEVALSILKDLKASGYQVKLG